jgi:hypothetical protein
MTAWNNFVKKIYHEGHSSDKNYSFKQALKDASARKSEMGKTNLAMGVKVKSKSSRKSRKTRKSKKSRKNRSRRSRK